MESDRETIFALASGSGVSGVAVIRLSGPSSWQTIKRLTAIELPMPRYLARRWITGSDGMRIDDALIVLFERASSFTGEESAEIHCHGSRAVVEAIYGELGRMEGCRMAEAGEFTRRAFVAGRMDLNAVEGLSDLLKAETEFQRRHALKVLSGGASDILERWRLDLVRARALIEVTIDWADEDVPQNVVPEVRELLSGLATAMSEELEKFSRTERMREGYEVAIVGPPNVGKSTLLNAIADRDVALTSEIAGTTRDVLEIRCDLGGFPVVFLDTAGLRDASDTIERAGIERAVQRAGSADLRILMSSADTGETQFDISEPGDIAVWSKADIHRKPDAINLVVTTGEGVTELLNLVQARLEERATDLGLFGRLRHQEALRNALAAITEVQPMLGKIDAEVIAEYLRVAISEIDLLSGRNAVEDVLGEVFSSFCLGK